MNDPNTLFELSAVVSAGIEPRNQVLLQALVKKIYPDDLDKQGSILDRIALFSYHDCINTKNLKQLELGFYSRHPSPSSALKNLRFVSSKTSNLVHIDDNPSCILGHELPNLLYVPSNDEKSDRINEWLSDKDFIKTENFARVNHIFYACGLLCLAAEKAASEKISISEAFFKLQYTTDDNDDQITFNINLINDFSIYQKGLVILQQYEPDITFVLPSTSHQNNTTTAAVLSRHGITKETGKNKRPRSKTEETLLQSTVPKRHCPL